MESGGFRMENKEKIRILIADDSISVQDHLAEVIQLQEDMEVIGFASDGEEAIELIESQNPDIAIIDLLMPLRDGLGVLEEVKERKLCHTACILISAIGLDSMAQKAILLGAQYYLIKPYRDEFLLGRIRQVHYEYHRIKVARLQKGYGSKELISSGRENQSPEQKVSCLLSQMHMSASIQGYYFLRQAILMALEDENAVVGITKRMYPELARKYHTTSNRVERAIRHAIESAWKKGANEIYGRMFEMECCSRPTNGQFIASIGEYFRMGH